MLIWQVVFFITTPLINSPWTQPLQNRRLTIQQLCIKFHLEGLREEGYPIPEPFDSDYTLIYKWDVESLMDYYKGILTLASLERITGINQTQLGHYAAGRSKPRKQQIQKIERALHRLGKELTTISF